MEYSDNYIGKLLDNRYEILERIGAGGMAVVYKARCHRLNRLVAVKILRSDFTQDADLRRRFHAESQAVAMLSHPNIVSVYDVGTAGNVDYIVMELIEGITLKQYINRKGVLSWKEALHFGTQIAKAIGHAHSRGIIHRDIKPHNIMILRDGSIKVTDFGIAYLLSTQNTLTQQALGSVHYISPEQAQGSHIDARTDIYSLGVVMYEMLTSRLPFEGESAVAIAIQHISSTPPAPRSLNPDIPVGLEMITMKAMEPNLDLRYESAEDLLFDLEEFRKNPMMVPAAESFSGAASEIKTVKREKPTVDTSTGDRTVQRSKIDSGSASESKGKGAPIIAALGLIAALGIIFFLMWNFFLKDMINPNTVTVTLDRFVGQDIDDVKLNATYSEKYLFDIVMENSDEYEEGYIISQDPSADVSLEVKDVDEKISIKLIVSAGREAQFMGNYFGMDYRQVINELNSMKLDLKIETSPVPSGEFEAGKVVDQYPDPDAELKKGSTVFISYSTGPDIEFVDVPTVTGISESQAKLRLDSNDLFYRIEYVHDDTEAGTVIFQSYEAGQSVPLHTEVVLQVSLGPETPPVVEPPVVEDPPVSDDPIGGEAPDEVGSDTSSGTNNGITGDSTGGENA